MNWIVVDKEGLQAVFPRQYILRELIANMFDEIPKGARNGSITITEGINNEFIIVAQDDAPKGFKDLTDSFTMFRYTDKRRNPEVRGRFNSGDKYVLAHSLQATIKSTTGTYHFNRNGTRGFEEDRTEKGSILSFLVELDNEELDLIIKQLRRIKRPNKFNLSVTLERTHYPPETIKIYSDRECKVGKAEGNLQTWQLGTDDVKVNISRRKTEVLIYEEDQSYIYEMGIPVQEIDDPFSYDVQQKVPLDQNREVVSDKYLREVRGICLIAVQNMLTEEDVSETWIDDALQSKSVDDDTFSRVVEKKHPKAVLWSSDQLANERATENGYNVVHPRSIPKRIRERMTDTGSVSRSSTLFPTTFESGSHVPRMEITDKMREVEAFAKKLAKATLGIKIRVDFINNPHVQTAAQFGGSFRQYVLTFNVGRLGEGWFASPREKIIDLLIHELAHYYSVSNDMPHLSVSYYDGLSKLGARMVEVALRNPELFET